MSPSASRSNMEFDTPSRRNKAGRKPSSFDTITERQQRQRSLILDEVREGGRERGREREGGREGGGRERGGEGGREGEREGASHRNLKVGGRLGGREREGGK